MSARECSALPSGRVGLFPLSIRPGPPYADGTLMAMLFRVCRDERQAWIVLVGDQLYGEYLGKDQAVLDAIEAVKDARAGGGEAEAWDEAKRLRLY